MNKKIIAIVITAIVIVGGVSFYGGMKYARANNSSRGNFTVMGQNSQFRNGGMGTRFSQGMGGVTAGQIISKDDKSITIKLQDGGSKIVFFTDKTTVTKSTTGSLVDLTVNENVFVNGSVNSNGSINAQTIQTGSSLPGFRQTTNPPVND